MAWVLQPGPCADPVCPRRNHSFAKPPLPHLHNAGIAELLGERITWSSLQCLGQSECSRMSRCLIPNLLATWYLYKRWMVALCPAWSEMSPWEMWVHRILFYKTRTGASYFILQNISHALCSFVLTAASESGGGQYSFSFTNEATEAGTGQ